MIPGKVRRVRTACMSAHASRARDAAASTAGPDPTRSTMSAPCSRTPAAASRSPDLYFCLAYVARSDASLPAGSSSSAVAAASGLADADDETRPAWIQRAPLPPRRRAPRGDSTRRRSALASMVCASRTVRRANTSTSVVSHIKGVSIFLELSVTVHPRSCIAASMT